MAEADAVGVKVAPSRLLEAARGSVERTEAADGARTLCTEEGPVLPKQPVAC
jgi:hypothetical protein